jgi:hypothetical protein
MLPRLVRELGDGSGRIRLSLLLIDNPEDGSPLSAEDAEFRARMEPASRCS